jgi:hypothetical protein
MSDRKRAAVAGLIALGAWLACGAAAGGEATEKPAAAPCTTAVDSVWASAGTTPSFFWAPECTIGRLIVEEGEEELWGTETEGPNTYVGPIQYGVHPPGSVEEEKAPALVAGHTYTVSLFRWITVSPESLQLLGTRPFTPQAP